ncbi:beta-galactosidase [uncultured Arthrobacter sp.]|uniref:beta-galactosidase n=1 Tax=uncultured Arthrobacter sp. TaxID=114050 RepID=UPI00262EB9FE|nr:beta-galactosidase [uncultured Arthrobacter sp.]
MPVLKITHVGWDAPETRPQMANDADTRDGFSLTNRSILRNGEPWIPVTGEMHYSRQPRESWADALRLMKAGGINVVATYIFWIHHQPHEQDAPDFEGDLDLAAFVKLCHEIGLEVILRLGPWCHGEVRNGGHPDWVVNADYTERTNDQRYLDAVRTWFGQIGQEVAGLCGSDGPVIGIQLENEIYDQPDHILALKDIARESGLFAPLWTATAWGSADIPVGEVFPLYGGYSDGFWVDTDQGWDESFQAHFTFSHQWDDPGIGKDLAGESWTGVVGAKHPDFPAATCELGGGMAKAYHRRPAPTAREIAAVALCKLGSGSAWQGYYMYVGGTNPRKGLQESHATGYPNDLPELNYDFGAPIGAHLQLRESFHRLRNQHSFLEAFGSRLGAMNATIPANDDDGGLRWSLRSDGLSGFVFINNHRPHEPLPARTGVQFDIGLKDSRVLFPHRPVDIPAGEFMAWPVQLEVGGVVVRWATLNVLTVLQAEGEPPVLVLTANDGVDAHLAIAAGCSVDGHPFTEVSGERVLENVDTAPGPITLTNDDGAQLRVLVLTAQQALNAWTPTVRGRRRLVLSDAAVVERDGSLEVLARSAGELAVMPPLGAAGDGFSYHRFEAESEAAEVTITQTAPASPPPARLVTVPGRASAPFPDDFAAHAARYTISVTGEAKAGVRSLLRLELVGDTAASSFEGREEDVFWDGSVWDIDITPAEDTDRRVLEVAVYPLAAGTPVWLPEEVDRVRVALTEPTAEITGASVVAFKAIHVTGSA